MSLPDDLLEQARHLAARERRKPKQASLRRALSATYYALFHLLTDEAASLIAPGQSLAQLRPRIQRAFIHREMEQSSRAFSFAGGAPKVPTEIAEMARTFSTPPADLVLVAEAFVDLQEARHEADYNASAKFTRQDVITTINTARDAFQAWRRIRSHPLSRAYLISLLIWNKWDTK
jgi:hypothetical protein